MGLKFIEMIPVFARLLFTKVHDFIRKGLEKSNIPGPFQISISPG
jgi:hypothetical protein